MWPFGTPKHLVDVARYHLGCVRWNNVTEMVKSWGSLGRMFFLGVWMLSFFCLFVCLFVCFFVWDLASLEQVFTSTENQSGASCFLVLWSCQTWMGNQPPASSESCPGLCSWSLSYFNIFHQPMGTLLVEVDYFYWYIIFTVQIPQAVMMMMMMMMMTMMTMMMMMMMMMMNIILKMMMIPFESGIPEVSESTPTSSNQPWCRAQEQQISWAKCWASCPCVPSS